MIPQDFPPYYSSMRNLAVFVIHLIATLARLLGPGGVRSLVAESLLLKHQLLIVNCSRQRSPNLSAADRILANAEHLPLPRLNDAYENLHMLTMLFLLLPFAALMLAATPSPHSSGVNLAVAGFVVRALSDHLLPSSHSS
jgi:hypothetical protein